MGDRVADLAPAALHRRIHKGLLRFRIGPFSVAVESCIKPLTQLIRVFYGSCPLEDASGFRDFHLAVSRPRSHRRWVRPYAVFAGDGETPFAPLPLAAAFALLEWGFNWRVATTAHQYLMLHAAVVELNGVGVLLPALPGSGKSTLTAALMSRGWRLLSDEFALIRPGTPFVTPFPRPIPLKNESISLIRQFHPDAVLGPTIAGTRKGDVAHLKVSEASILRMDVPTKIDRIVFPQYRENATGNLRDVAKARSFLKVCSNSFNYDMLGSDGFQTVAGLIDAASCHSFEYSSLDEAVSLFAQL